MTQKAQITEEKKLTCWPSPFKAFVLQNKNLKASHRLTFLVTFGHSKVNGRNVKYGEGLAFGKVSCEVKHIT